MPRCKPLFFLCFAVKVRAQGGATVTANTEFIPEVEFEGEWYPICGKGFWDNNFGATTVCNRLGFSSGTLQKTHSRFTKVAMPVGKCEHGDSLDKCVFIDQHRWGKLTCRPGSGKYCCPAGQRVGITVKCTGS